ncbi:cysteine methyltransferase [Palleniella muris]|uniref:Cysteine methyltransferase n=1 Tax=Palleniella muris TaxID=3038145 RepID=A0AC61QT30_9BACT|nr:cysteine methyltransferase [Palleniella muris]
MMEKEFTDGVYEVVNAIPAGKVLTYGLVAKLAGWPNRSRMVGHLLKGCSAKNGIPCHRVVNSCGRLAPGWAEQADLLKTEGVIIKANGYVDMKQHLWNFDESVP